MLPGDEICARKSHESPIHRRKNVRNFLFPYELVTGATVLAASDVVYRRRRPAKTLHGSVRTEKNARSKKSTARARARGAAVAGNPFYGRVSNFTVDVEPRKCIHGYTLQTPVTCSRPSKHRVRKTGLTGGGGRALAGERARAGEARRGMIAFDASNKVTLHASRRGNPFLQLARVWISSPSPPSPRPLPSLREGGNRATV